MIPVFSKTKTDTMAACVASILEMDIEEIPDFFSTEAHYKDPLYELQTFLEDAGWLLIERPYLREGVLGMAICSFGEDARQYAAVYQDGVIHDPRPPGSPVGRPEAYFILAPADITDYVKTVAVQSENPDHAYWSQVEPGTPFFVWYKDAEVFRKVFRFYTDGQAWFSNTMQCVKADAFYHATPAVSVI